MSGLEKFFELSIMGELVRSTILLDKIQKSDSLTQCSPLMIAIARNDCEMLCTLLDGGADANESDGDGLTPLMAASVLGRKEIIGTLLSHGADVNARTKDGHTAIMYASFFSDSDCVKLLINGGADLRSKNRANKTSGRTFPDALTFYIKEYTNHPGHKNSDIYKNTKISDKNYALSKMTFAKIIRNINSEKRENYHPKKNTVLLLALGMRLSLEQTEDLLSSAGYHFDVQSAFDMIVRKSMEEGNYDVGKINDALFKETGKTLCGFWEKDYSLSEN